MNTAQVQIFSLLIHSLTSLSSFERLCPIHLILLLQYKEFTTITVTLKKNHKILTLRARLRNLGANLPCNTLTLISERSDTATFSCIF